jgi:integrase
MLNYKYAELSKGLKWYVHYMVLNPATGRLVRRRIYLQHIKDAKLKERYARKLCNKINDKLDQGWNPFVTEKDNKQYTDLKKAFDFLLTYKGSYLSKRCVENYKNRIKMFMEYLKANKMDSLFVFELNDTHALAFFEYLLIKKGVSGRTFNNYLLDFRTFFNFFVKHRYASTNPFLVVTELPETEKEKQPFTQEETVKYSEYCLANEPDFYVMSGLCYYCGFRPVEITRLKVSQIDRENKLIKLPGASTKNKRNRTVPIPDIFWPYIQKHIQGALSTDYFCGKGFVPNKTPIVAQRIAKKFRLIADEIGLPGYIKFYGLKDTAAERLDQSQVGLKTIRDLFGHQNIATTDAYMRGFRNRELEGLRTIFPPL